MFDNTTPEKGKLTKAAKELLGILIDQFESQFKSKSLFEPKKRKHFLTDQGDIFVYGNAGFLAKIFGFVPTEKVITFYDLINAIIDSMTTSFESLRGDRVQKAIRAQLQRAIGTNDRTVLVYTLFGTLLGAETNRITIKNNQDTNLRNINLFNFSDDDSGQQNRGNSKNQKQSNSNNKKRPTPKSEACDGASGLFCSCGQPHNISNNFAVWPINDFVTGRRTGQIPVAISNTCQGMVPYAPTEQDFLADDTQRIIPIYKIDNKGM